LRYVRESRGKGKNNARFFHRPNSFFGFFSWCCFQMAELLASMSKDSPLEDIVGKPSASERSASSDDKTYANVMDEWSKASKGHADKFKAFALDYVAQWESTVATRITTDTKETDKLRRDADHYKVKVESLEKTIQKLQEKNKPVPEATTEKLNRNQEKLDEANTTYNRAAENLVALMEEVVDRSWRDLHPLLVKCLKFDLDVHGEEDEILKSVEVCVDDLLELSRAENIQPRLDEIVQATPQEFTTTASMAPSSPRSNDNVDKKAENDVLDNDEPAPEQPLAKSSSGGSSVNPFDEE
jgi:hypothetical protein